VVMPNLFDMRRNNHTFSGWRSNFFGWNTTPLTFW
jgi:hypothetical protein